MAVAERLYYADSSLLEFAATVTEIRELARVDGRPVFQVALDRTAFYPTGGGQPYDTGLLVATARSGAVLEAPITDVTEDDAGEVWHTTAKPLQPGTDVVGRVDERRRRDHMQQHSGQHLLSAVARQELGASTVGFHLGTVETTIDLSLSALTSEQLALLQQRTNEFVMRSLPVRELWITRAEAETLLAQGVLPKLPPREGDLRVVQIGQIDQNACGGTHVANTAAIGPLLLRRTEKTKGRTRLSFLCGERALQAASDDWQRLSGVARLLSTATESVSERVSAIQEELVVIRRQLRQSAALPK